MKLVAVACLVASALAAKNKEPFMKKKAAYGFFDFTTASSGKGNLYTTATTQAPARTRAPTMAVEDNVFESVDSHLNSPLFDKYHLTSVESWEEFKDKLEENHNVPEEEVDELERCVASCWWKDNWKDLGGHAHEEVKEKAEEAGIEHPKACPKCIEKIPEWCGVDNQGAASALLNNANQIMGMFGV